MRCLRPRAKPTHPSRLPMTCPSRWIPALLNALIVLSFLPLFPSSFAGSNYHVDSRQIWSRGHQRHTKEIQGELAPRKQLEFVPRRIRSSMRFETRSRLMWRLRLSITAEHSIMRWSSRKFSRIQYGWCFLSLSSVWFQISSFTLTHSPIPPPTPSSSANPPPLFPSRQIDTCSGAQVIYEGAGKFHGTKQTTESVVKLQIYAGKRLNVLYVSNFFIPASFRS